MICTNCHSIIADIDDVYYGDQDVYGEDPMCGQCAPEYWMHLDFLEPDFYAGDEDE